MPDYVRAYIPGGTYFFTVALLERRRRLLTEHIDALRDAFQKIKRERPFNFGAFVILPDHLHCLWTVPENDTDFSTRWRLIKSHFTRAIEPGERLSPRRQQKKERGVWQRRFWEHAIRDQRDFDAHLDYIHYNPVKHGWVSRAADWPHSSFHQFVKDGLYSANWAAPEDVRETSRE